MSFPEIVSVVKDIVTIITLVVGAGITVYGVNTWRKQLTAKAEYDLAKRILNAVNNVRDELFLFAGVLSSNREFSQETYTDLNRNLKKAQTDFEIELIEADVMWGDNLDFNKPTQRLIDFCYVLRNYYDRHIFQKEKIENVTEMNLDEVDETVKRIKDFLRLKLKFSKS